jgi:hypothetical protein
MQDDDNFPARLAKKALSLRLMSLEHSGHFIREELHTGKLVPFWKQQRRPPSASFRC